MRKWLDDYVMTVRRFDASVRLAGGRTLFAVQSEALGESMKPLTPEEKVICEHWNYYKCYILEGRGRLVARMKEVSQQNNIWFSDISDEFSGENGQVYLDYTHLTDREMNWWRSGWLNPSIVRCSTSNRSRAIKRLL